MSVEFEVSDVIPASPEEIYEAWLDSEEHSRMTGGQAKVSPNVGDTFEAWDGYIQGKNLELEYPRRILQEWRTTEFDETEKDSRLEILLDPAGEGTSVTIRHSDLPEHGMQYQQGWIDAYLLPMKTYFGDKMKTSTP
jgi:uncharacterized protein YndB with AHSA1/START domain